MHGDIYSVKYRQPDILYEPVLFEPIKQIVVSSTIIKVTGFVDFGTYFYFPNRYIKWLEEQLTDIVPNPSHKFTEGKLSKVIMQTPSQGIKVAPYLISTLQSFLHYLTNRLRNILPNGNILKYTSNIHRYPRSHVNSSCSSETLKQPPPGPNQSGLLEKKCSFYNR